MTNSNYRKFNATEDQIQSHIDTQILSYQFKKGDPIANNTISTIAISEFLEIYDNGISRYRFYIPPKIQDMTSERMYINSSKHILGRKTADKFIISCDSPKIDIIYRSNITLANLINYGSPDQFTLCIHHLDKNFKKKLRERFVYLLENNVRAIPVGLKAESIIIDMVRLYFRSHNSKENTRNSINDILIFSTAIASDAKLITNDNELKRFIASNLKLKIDNLENGLIAIHSSYSVKIPNTRDDTKGYVNTGWRIKLNI